jgi:hypothetical protein
MEGVQMSDTPISDSTPHNVAELGMLCRRLERQLNEANKTNRLQYELITTAEKRGVDKSKEELNKANDRIKRLEEQNYTMRARLYPTRPRIPIEKKRAIADAPQNISISELARKFDVSYGTVARYRRKAKEAKP